LREVAKLLSDFLRHSQDFFFQNGFIETIVPHLTKATGACENIDTMFEVGFFGSRAFLAQTGQLYLETLVDKYNKVWCIGSSFRAENVVDDRHLSEFTLLEIELKGDFEALLSTIEQYFKYVFSKLGRSFQAGRITYTEAIDKLKHEGFEVEWGDDLNSNMEKSLSKDAPLFITHYPKQIKFFNMKENCSDDKIVNSADLILPKVGESVGAAEREHRHDQLLLRLKESPMLKKLLEKGGTIADFNWYLNYYLEDRELHSGCGIGVNRVLQYLLDASDIRDTSLFPITPTSIY
jgi:asparaginyl-tRNA synthetase